MTITHSTDVYYDPYHIDIVNDPYPVYARLREEAPIYYNERYDFWAISRYADVEKALSDWETFSNSRGDIPAGANRLDPSHCTSAARAPRRRGIGRRSTVVPVRAAIRVVGTAMAVAALVLTTPGSAAADATDDAFSRKLFADAVNFGPQEAVIKKARMVCDGFNAGMSPAEVHETILNGSATVEGSALSPRQAAVFMADAVQFYCPGYAGLFIR